jgi:LPXTG-motif cell wall-anchored protein
VQPTQIEVCFAGGKILVYKFEDLDKDGVYDNGEPMLPDWEFSLTAMYEEPWLVHVGLTDADGEFLFPTLEPGVEHVVTETLKPGWISTTGLTQDGIYVEGDGITEVWFGNAREELPPEEEEEELLPKTGIDPMPIVGAAAALASAGVAGVFIRRRRH